MADERPPPRTFTIDEVGRIIRRASAEGARAPASIDHERLTLDELKEIAAEVGVSDAALERVLAAPPEPVAAEPAAGENSHRSVPATATGTQAMVPASGGHGSLGVDLLVGGTAVAFAGAADLTLGLHGIAFGITGVVALVSIGARALFRSWHRLTGGLIHAPARASNADRYHRIVFGTGTVDLTHVPDEGDRPHVVDVDAVFSEVVVRIDPKIPYRIESSVTFGEARVPAPSSSSNTPPKLVVHLKVVFGTARVVLVGNGEGTLAERLVTALTGRR